MSGALTRFFSGGLQNNCPHQGSWLRSPGPWPGRVATQGAAPGTGGTATECEFTDSEGRPNPFHKQLETADSHNERMHKRLPDVQAALRDREAEREESEKLAEQLDALKVRLKSG